MIGSAIAWGRDGAVVAQNERALFDRYLEALALAGCDASVGDIRRGFFGQYSGYLCFAAAIPALLVDEVFPIALLEQRFNAPVEEIPRLVAGIVALLPQYVEELRQLGARLAGGGPLVAAPEERMWGARPSRPHAVSRCCHLAQVGCSG
jgi:hypothetical protein